LKRRRLGSVPVRGGNRLGTCRSLRRDGALGLRRRSKQVLVAPSNRRRAHQGEHRRVGASRSGACRQPLPIAVTVRNRGSRPALDVRTCVRLPRGLGLARSGGATLRNGESVGGLPGLRRELVASSGPRARQLRARLTNGQHHRPWRRRAPPHRADPTPDHLRGAAPALHRLTTVAPARRGRF
jgi:hypothetical protein